MKLVVNKDPWEPVVCSYKSGRDDRFVEDGSMVVVEATVEEWREYLMAKSFVRFFNAKMQDKARKALVGLAEV